MVGVFLAFQSALHPEAWKVLGALLAIPIAAGLLLLYEEVLVPRQAHA